MEFVQSRNHQTANFPRSSFWHVRFNIETVSTVKLFTVFFRHCLGVNSKTFQERKSEKYVLSCQPIVRDEKSYIGKYKWNCSKAQKNRWHCPRFWKLQSFASLLSFSATWILIGWILENFLIPLMMWLFLHCHYDRGLFIPLILRDQYRWWWMMDSKYLSSRCGWGGRRSCSLMRQQCPVWLDLYAHE